MKIIRASIYLLVFIFISGCNTKTTNKQLNIDDISFYSDVLKKDMQLKVYTPNEYSEDIEYPVLYFLPDYGGSIYTVMNQYKIAEKAENLISENKINPIIIVAVDIEKSFGINSSEEIESYETPTGKTFNKGKYEDYVCKEVISLIDSKYSTIDEKKGRYIGGYSMGGFAALHISFRNPDLFSKVGGHSPSIFINDFPDKSVSDWLYPNEDIRMELDPIKIAQNKKIEGLTVFLDVEVGGSTGVEHLYIILVDNKIDAEFHELSLSHSRASCEQNMNEYLLFYAGVSETD